MSVRLCECGCVYVCLCVYVGLCACVRVCMCTAPVSMCVCVCVCSPRRRDVDDDDDDDDVVSCVDDVTSLPAMDMCACADVCVRVHVTVSKGAFVCLCGIVCL